MTTTVLAYIPSPAQGVWQLGSVPLRAYALFIIVGIIAALVIGDRRWEARGGEPGVVYDVAMWAVPFGLIGGRIYHVFTDWPTYFGPGGAGFVAALRIWDGGLGIWGAVALGGIGAWIACRRRGIPLPAFGDAIAPGIVLAQAIGRLGNYFNQELYGRPTTLPWGLEIYERRNAAGALDSLNGVSTGQLLAVVHPTFLYELLWNLLIFVVLIVIDRRFKIGHGRLFAMYVAGYCLGRFWIELMRSDAATLLAGIRVNSFTATFVFIGAVVYIMAAPKGRDDPATLRGRQDTEDTQEIEGQETAGVEEIAEEVAVGASTTGLVAAAMVADAEAGSVVEADAEASADGGEDAEAGDADAGEDAEVEESETEESESVEEVAEADVEASADGGEDADDAEDAEAANADGVEDAEAADAGEDAEAGDAGEDAEAGDADSGEDAEVEESEAEESEADSVAVADAEAAADGGEDAEAGDAAGGEDTESADADAGEESEVEESDAEESESVEEVADAKVAEADSVAEADAEASADGGEDADAGDADGGEGAEADDADGDEDAEADDADAGEESDAEESESVEEVAEADAEDSADGGEDADAGEESESVEKVAEGDSVAEADAKASADGAEDAEAGDTDGADGDQVEVDQVEEDQVEEDGAESAGGLRRWLRRRRSR